MNKLLHSWNDNEKQSILPFTWFQMKKTIRSKKKTNHSRYENKLNKEKINNNNNKTYIQRAYNNQNKLSEREQSEQQQQQQWWRRQIKHRHRPKKIYKKNIINMNPWFCIISHEDVFLPLKPQHIQCKRESTKMKEEN